MLPGDAARRVGDVREAEPTRGGRRAWMRLVARRQDGLEVRDGQLARADERECADEPTHHARQKGVGGETELQLDGFRAWLSARLGYRRLSAGGALLALGGEQRPHGMAAEAVVAPVVRAGAEGGEVVLAEQRPRRLTHGRNVQLAREAPGVALAQRIA